MAAAPAARWKSNPGWSAYPVGARFSVVLQPEEPDHTLWRRVTPAFEHVPLTVVPTLPVTTFGTPSVRR
jgi:hypothetical protein